MCWRHIALGGHGQRELLAGSQLAWHLWQEWNHTQHTPKFIFAADDVEFACFEVTLTDVRLCKQYLEAILKFPTPANITDICSSFGLINQVSYTFSMIEWMVPFRQFLKPDTPFHWDQDMDSLFMESKLQIVHETEHGVRIFDKSKPTCLTTDWSKTGIGFCLFTLVHAPGSISVCACWGWSPGSSQCTGQSPILHTWLFQLDHCCGPQTTAVDIRGSVPWCYLEPPYQEPEGEDTALSAHMMHIPGVKNRAADAPSHRPTNNFLVPSSYETTRWYCCCTGLLSPSSPPAPFTAPSWLVSVYLSPNPPQTTSMTLCLLQGLLPFPTSRLSHGT